MPELRKDPITARWVAYAPDRARRPLHYDALPDLPDEGYCPFCPGHEDATPGEILAYREPGTPANGNGWRVRVVPNRFPALHIEGELNEQGDGIYDRMEGIGAHEVIIESPEHITDLRDSSEQQIREVLWAYRDRLVDLKKDRRLVHGQIFKNKGAAAGASIPHTHSQLLVQPIIPAEVQTELRGSLEFFNYRGRCIYCDMLRQEHSDGSRIVLETSHFIAICPYASRFTFETWILPRVHSSHFENIPSQSIEDFAHVLKTVLAKLSNAVGDPAYNYVIHTAPFNAAELPHYHWHMEILPRLSQVAGFEWGSGSYINAVFPEDAAEALRKA